METHRCAALLAIAMVAAGCSGTSAKITDQDHARLDKAIAASEAQAKAFVDARTAALRTALAKPPTTAGPCTFALPPANALVVYRADGPGGSNAAAARTAKLHFTLVPTWALDGSPPPPTRAERESLWARMGLKGTNSGQYELSLDHVKTIVARGTYDAGDDATKLLAWVDGLGALYWDWELVVVTDRVTAPHELDNATFAPGEVTGRSLLWSYKDGRIRCAGAVLAQNSDSVMSIKVAQQLKSGKNGFLDGDLEDQAFAAAVTGLHDVTR